MRTKLTIKAIILDLDGTIAAFNLDYRALRADVRGYLIRVGIPASLLSTKESIFEMLKNAELRMKNEEKPESAIADMRRHVMHIAEQYEAEAAETTSLLPGAIETLKKLKKGGLKVGLCTINGEKATRHILERFKLTEYFDAVVPRDQVAQVKPNPEHCELALKALGISAAEVIAVGDSASDIQGAKDLKILAVGLPTGVASQEQLENQGANFVITSIVDLPVLIERLNKSEKELDSNRTS